MAGDKRKEKKMETKVKVYSTPTCPWCIRLKEYLKAKKVEFTNIDVAADPVAAREMIQKSGQMGVPQIEIGERIIVGFDQATIETELKKQKLL